MHPWPEILNALCIYLFLFIYFWVLYFIVLAFKWLKRNKWYWRTLELYINIYLLRDAISLKIASKLNNSNEGYEWSLRNESVCFLKISYK